MKKYIKNSAHKIKRKKIPAENCLYSKIYTTLNKINQQFVFR